MMAFTEIIAKKCAIHADMHLKHATNNPEIVLVSTVLKAYIVWMIVIGYITAPNVPKAAVAVVTSCVIMSMENATRKNRIRFK